MLKRFSNEQLEKLLIHTIGINSVLTEALISGQDEPPFEADTIAGIDLDILVIDPNGKGRQTMREEEPEVRNLDHLCGEWQGGKKKPELLIFKAEPGYMAAWGKKPKDGEAGDCYLINEVNGNLCVSMGLGFVYLSYDGERDVLKIHPGGEYTRTGETKK